MTTFSAEYSFGNVQTFIKPLPEGQQWSFKIKTSVGHKLVSQKLSDQIQFIVPADLS